MNCKNIFRNIYYNFRIIYIYICKIGEVVWNLIINMTINPFKNL